MCVLENCSDTDGTDIDETLEMATRSFSVMDKLKSTIRASSKAREEASVECYFSVVFENIISKYVTKILVGPPL